MSDSSSPSFDLPEAERFTAGTVGEPGARTFYLQIEGIGLLVSLKLEKQQVAALAEYLDNMLQDMPAPQEPNLPFDLGLVEPIFPEWVVATMGVAYSDAADRVVIWAEEMMAEEEADDEPATARFQISRAQAIAFVHHARELVRAGRPPCPYCSAPLNDDGSWCACSN